MKQHLLIVYIVNQGITQHIYQKIIAWSTPQTSSTSKKVFGISGRCLFSDEANEYITMCVNSSNASSTWQPILPKPETQSAASSALRNKPTTKYRPPDFIQTVKCMRNVLYAVTKTQCTEEPPSDKLSLTMWKAALRKEHWFSDENQLKFYIKTARLSKRCFGKVLELDEGMKNGIVSIGAAKRCSQTVLRDILYNLSEVEQYEILCGMVKGEVKLASLRKNKATDKETKSSSEDEKTLLKKITDLNNWKTDLQLRLEDMTRHNEDLRLKNKDLKEKFSFLEKELETTKSLLQNVQKERDYWQKQFVEATVLTQSKVIRTGKKSDKNINEDGTYPVGKDHDLGKVEEAQPTSNVDRTDNDDSKYRGDAQPPDFYNDGSEYLGDATLDLDNDVLDNRVRSSAHPCFIMILNSIFFSLKKETHIDLVPSSDDEMDNLTGTPDYIRTESFTLNMDALRRNWEMKSTEDGAELTVPQDQVSVSIKHTANTKRSRSPESEINTTKNTKQAKIVESVQTGFVAVAYTATMPRPATFHLGKIVEQSSIENTQAKVTFLEKLKSGVYRWPRKENVEMVLRHQVFATEIKATVDNSNGLLFKEEELLSDFNRCVGALLKLERNSKVEEMWERTEAPFRKVGIVTWKDLKTLQLEMDPVHKSLMTTEIMPRTLHWQVGYLNDEVMDEYIKLLEKMANKKGSNSQH